MIDVPEIKEKTYSIRLALPELLLVDGKVDETQQKIIDTAKREAAVGMPIPLLNHVITESEKTGTLTWSFLQINSCDLCDKKQGYWTYDRNGRYHRKGDTDYKHPKSYSGVKFNEGFIRMTGYGDCCVECFNSLKMVELLTDYILDNDLKIEIQKNNYKHTKYRKDEQRKCYQCKETMFESEMGRRSTLFGDGTYPSKCPHCGAEDVAFGRSHEITREFRHI
jgi:hypothetical protein